MFDPIYYEGLGVDPIYHEGLAFDIVYNKVAEFEGGYSNHPSDRGGETFCGISRMHFPNWSGWGLLDGYINKQDAAKNSKLKSMVKSFYRQNFWDYFDLDALACSSNKITSSANKVTSSANTVASSPSIVDSSANTVASSSNPMHFDLDALANANYALAYEIYEQAINLGVSRATKNLQKVANTLNYRQKFGADLSVDGAFGVRSKARLAALAQAGKQTCLALAKGMNALQGAQYIEIATKDSSQRVFSLGWLSKRA